MVVTMARNGVLSFLRLIALAGGFSAALAPLGGCTSQAPLARPYPMQSQYKMQTASHWNYYAELLAWRLEEQTRRDHDFAGPIYIQPAQTPTRFNQAFHNYLAAQMQSAGLPVASTPEGAMVLKFTTQVVAHQGDVSTRPPPGLFTLGGAAVGAPFYATNYALPPLVQGGIFLGYGFLADLVLGDLNTVTDTEVIVAVTVTDGDVVRLRLADTFYILDGDYVHFEPPPKPKRYVWY